MVRGVIWGDVLNTTKFISAIFTPVRACREIEWHRRDIDSEMENVRDTHTHTHTARINCGIYSRASRRQVCGSRLYRSLVKMGFRRSRLILYLAPREMHLPLALSSSNRISLSSLIVTNSPRMRKCIHMYVCGNTVTYCSMNAADAVNRPDSRNGMPDAITDLPPYASAS